MPAPFARDAFIEAVDAGIRLAVIVTEHIPFHDMLSMYHYGQSRGARIIGPNCPGIASPGRAKVGIIPNVVFHPGRVGVISRSGTLTYEIVSGIKEHGLGQSTCIGLGGDPVIGTSFVDALPMFEKNPDTDRIVLVGEIGGTAEEDAAAAIKSHVSKPVVAYVAGRSAPPGKRMGHAGAIIARGKGTAESKVGGAPIGRGRGRHLPVRDPRPRGEPAEGAGPAMSPVDRPRPASESPPEHCAVAGCEGSALRHLSLAEARKAFPDLPEAGRRALRCAERTTRNGRRLRRSREPSTASPGHPPRSEDRLGDPGEALSSLAEGNGSPTACASSGPACGVACASCAISSACGRASSRRVSSVSFRSGPRRRGLLLAAYSGTPRFLVGGGPPGLVQPRPSRARPASDRSRSAHGSGT